MTTNHLYVWTPTYENPLMNARLDKRVFLKMECYQPTGSFKARGIGHLCQQAVEAGTKYLVSSSGGNAGYTAAYAGRMLNTPVTVVVPETTSEVARQRMAGEGAEVIVHGAVWDEADRYARQLVAARNGTYIHPFDNPVIWEGHASLIDEAVTQCPKPAAVVVSVGGGGLLCGVVAGMQRNGWEDVPVIAVETKGAHSLAASMTAGKLTALSAITSIANTLGALQVTPKALEWTQHHPIQSAVVSDAQAVRACLQFADEMRVIVEPACGASLSLLYDNAHLLAEVQSVLVIVCGGAGVTMDKLTEWSQQFS